MQLFFSLLYPTGAFFESIKYVELASTLLMGSIAALPLIFPDVNPADFYRMMGGGGIVSVDTLCVLSPALTILGGNVLLGGAVLAYGVRVGFNRAKKEE